MLVLLVVCGMMCLLAGVGVLLYMNNNGTGTTTTKPPGTAPSKPPGKPPGNTGGGALTKAEVAKHNKSGSDCWVIINGQVYNLSSFDHAGGASKIKCGTDVSSKFKGQHGSGKKQLSEVENTKKGPVSG